MIRMPDWTSQHYLRTDPRSDARCAARTHRARRRKLASGHHLMKRLSRRFLVARQGKRRRLASLVTPEWEWRFDHDLCRTQPGRTEGGLEGGHFDCCLSHGYVWSLKVLAGRPAGVCRSLIKKDAKGMPRAPPNHAVITMALPLHGSYSLSDLMVRRAVRIGRGRMSAQELIE